MPEDLGTLRVKVSADIGNLKAGFAQVKSETDSLARATEKLSFTSVIEQNRAGLTNLGLALAGAGMAMTGFATISTKTFLDFDTGMRNVQSVMQGSEEDFRTLSKFALQLGKDTAFSAKEAAQALYYMASAGFSVKEQMQATRAVLNLAAATQTDLARASELVATTLTAYRLPATEAGRVTDTLAKAIGVSQATFDKLAYSLPYVATQAYLLGYSLEDTVAALALLYDGGLKGEMAGTRLREALNDLLDPTKEQTAAIEALGLKISDVNPATNSLVDIVRNFERVGLTAADAAKIFGARAEGMTILVTQGADKLQRMTEQLKSAGNAAEQMAKIQMAGLGGALEQLRGSLETMRIKLGEALAPTLIDIMKKLENLVDAFTSLPAPIQSGIAQFTAFSGAAALLGGSLLLIISRIPDFINGLSAIKALILTITGSLTAMNTALLGIGAGVAVIGSLAAALWAYKDAQTRAKEDVDKFSPTIIDLQEKIRTLMQAQSKLTDAVRAGTEQVSLYQLGLAKVPTPMMDISSAQKIVNDQLKEAQGKLAAVDAGYASVLRMVESNKQKQPELAKELQLTGATMEKHATQTAAVASAYEELRKGTIEGIKSMSALAEQVRGSRFVTETFTNIEDAINRATSRYGEYFSFIKENESGVTLYVDTEHKKRIDSAIQMSRDLVGNAVETYRQQDAIRDANWEKLKADAEKLNAELLKRDMDRAREQTKVLSDFALFEGYTYEQRKQDIIAVYDTLLTKYENDAEAKKAINAAMNETLTALDTAHAKHYEMLGIKRMELDASISENAIKLAEKDAQEIGQIRETMFERDFRIAQEYVQKMEQEAQKRWEREEQMISRFQQYELDSYAARRDAILEKYNEMFEIYTKHGYDTVELERWKTEEMMKLAKYRINSELDETNKFLGSVSHLYGLFYKVKDDEEESWFKRSIDRLQRFIDETKKAVDSAITIWQTLIRVLNILNSLLGSDGGTVGLLSAVGMQSAQAGQVATTSLAQIGMTATSVTSAISGIGSALAGVASLAIPLAAVAAAGTAVGYGIGKTEFAAEHPTISGLLAQIVGGLAGTVGFRWGQRSSDAERRQQLEQAQAEVERELQRVRAENEQRTKRMNEAYASWQKLYEQQAKEQEQLRAIFMRNLTPSAQELQNLLVAYPQLADMYRQAGYVIEMGTRTSAGGRVGYVNVALPQTTTPSYMERAVYAQPTININAGTIIASQQSIDEFARLIASSMKSQGLLRYA